MALAAFALASCAKKDGDGAADAAATQDAVSVPAAVSAADVEAGINATFAKVHELLARGASGAEVAEVLYEDDLTITGEGEKGLYPDLKSFIEPLHAYTRNPTCRLKVVDKVRHSGDLAAAWVAEHCDAHEKDAAEDYRMIYVFRNGPKGWRVTMEMFAVGNF
ncbi:MAG: hypothetical protein AB7N70_27175 [Dehalococcoidia bacterium]